LRHDFFNPHYRNRFNHGCFLNAVDGIFYGGAEMKTFLGMNFVGWAWLGCAAFCCACWAPVVMAVVR